MTLQQHCELSAAVEQLRRLLMKSHVFCIGTKASKESRAVRSTLQAIDRLRIQLQHVEARDFPGYVPF